jgi:hypothetical protein
LKLAGAATLSVVATPMFVPSERLDFGVPKQRLIVLSDEELWESIRPDIERDMAEQFEQSFYVVPRSGHDEVWERGIERFMRSFGASEYRIDEYGARGLASVALDLPEITACRDPYTMPRDFMDVLTCRFSSVDEVSVNIPIPEYTLRDMIEGRA